MIPRWANETLPDPGKAAESPYDDPRVRGFWTAAQSWMTTGNVTDLRVSSDDQKWLAWFGGCRGNPVKILDKAIQASFSPEGIDGVVQYAEKLGCWDDTQAITGELAGSGDSGGACSYPPFKSRRD